MKRSRRNRRNRRNKNRKNKNKKDKKNQQVQEPVEDTGPTKPMAVKTSKVTREGGLGIKSNQKMEKPSFLTKGRRLYIQNYEEHPVTGRRVLIGLTELDVQRDVVDLSFITETD